MSLTGMVLDVSGSMKSNIGSGTDEKGGPWARSIFKVIDGLIEHDVSSDNQVFAIGVGASCSKEIFDIIGTVQQIDLERKEMPGYCKNEPATEDHINKILHILERNGARNIRNWGKVNIIQEVVSDYMAALILMKLEADKHFLRKFVYEFLPTGCRNMVPKASVKTTTAAAFGVNVVAGIICPAYALFAAGLTVTSILAAPVAEDFASAGASKFRPATKEDISQVVEKVKCYFLNDVGKHSTFSVKDASRIIRGCIDEKELTTKRSRELLEYVEPFIYGKTPLYKSLDMATELFQNSISKSKQLFVLSDGKPTDGSNENTRKISQLDSKLREARVKVVSCFITKSTDIEPKRLYDEVQDNWKPGARFLFLLSSKWPTQHLPRAILVKRGWSIDIANNATKLFMQVNHPDNLREACSLAENAVCCPEALSELLVSVDLDIYINQETRGFEARNQKGGTCYANASAAVLHLAMKRILGRVGGYPDFDALRKEMIQSFGNEGAHIGEVLQNMCPKYRLRFHELVGKNAKEETQKAKEAIVGKRPVLATFWLADPCTCCTNKTSEWDGFSNFYTKNPDGILTENELDISKRCPEAPVVGHAVVLTSYNNKCLTLMNSWGSTWGYMGFFRVKNAEVLQLKFVDVFWTENYLTPEERDYYKKHGSEIACKLMSSLKGLQKAKYTCPKCNKPSLVTEFTGTLSEVKCPECKRTFSTSDNEGNILALNMYLISLSR